MNIDNFTDIEYSRPIHTLLSDSTKYSPVDRPTAYEFHRRLLEWKSAKENFHTQNLLEWRHMQLMLFPKNMPHKIHWTNIFDICEILNRAVSTNNLNHTYFSYGGMDLHDVKIINQEVLSLNFISVDHYFCPKSLELILWPEAKEWSYFWLSRDELVSKKKTKEVQWIHDFDECVWLPSDEIVERNYWDSGQYMHKGLLKPLPNGAKLLVMINDADLVIFAKRSPYNLDTSTYDGRHNQLGSARFYEYIRAHVEWQKNGERGFPKVEKMGPAPIGFRIKRQP